MPQLYLTRTQRRPRDIPDFRWILLCAIAFRLFSVGAHAPPGFGPGCRFCLVVIVRFVVRKSWYLKASLLFVQFQRGQRHGHIATLRLENESETYPAAKVLVRYFLHTENARLGRLC